ncbi:ATP-binding protein [Clostridium sp. ATCC 25772]|uniref:sensor histidine kinase n=1 Tax=Clostridium sp. ATCC 25772 TaxID=1676991 RepID=UPI0007810403|nr:ATP-binding protein [Clostridium sp. ATCC 25772]
MNLELTEDKKTISRLDINKIIMYIALILLIISFLGAFYIKYLPIDKYITAYDFKIINGTLAIISMASCWIYYYTYKKSDFFIISLFYLSFTVERLYINFKLYNQSHDLNARLSLIIGAYILRTVLITFTVKKEQNKLIKLMENNKIFSIITIIILTILLNNFELNLSKINNNMFKQNLYLNINCIFIIYYIFILTLLTKKSEKNKDFIYTIIILSLGFFTIKRIYLLYFIKFKIENIYISCNILTFLGFNSLILGLFIEMIIKEKESDRLKKELKIFYELAEYNQRNEIVVYDENENIVYANKKIRESSCNKFSSREEQNKELEFRLKKNIIFNDKKEIEFKIEKDGLYKKVLFNDGKVHNLDIQKIHLNNNVDRMVCTLVDMSDEYEAHKRLVISENKLATITENIKDLIITIDNNGIITYVNNAVLETLDYDRNELNNKHYSKLINFKVCNNKFLDSDYENHIWIKHKILTKQEKLIVVDSLISNMLNEEGQAIGKIIVSRDLSCKNEVDILKEKYDEIKEYDRIKTEIFSNLSHEVRTPINIIYSSVQLLNNKKNLSTEDFLCSYDKYESIIRENCNRMLKLVNNLLDITKIESGFMKMNFKDYNVVKLIEDVTMSVVPYADIKNINIIFDTDFEELEIKSDKDKLEQVILNLLSNAIKFTEEQGNILVYISKEDDFVIIRVKDDGIGIPKEFREHIFDRFAQSNKNYNKEKSGTGIGLALVKSLIALHDGKVYLNEELEEGSEFIIKLPIVKCNCKDEMNMLLMNNSIKSVNEKVSVEFYDLY